MAILFADFFSEFLTPKRISMIHACLCPRWPCRRCLHVVGRLWSGAHCRTTAKFSLSFFGDFGLFLICSYRISLEIFRFCCCCCCCYCKKKLNKTADTQDRQPHRTCSHCGLFTLVCDLTECVCAWTVLYMRVVHSKSVLWIDWWWVFRTVMRFCGSRYVIRPRARMSWMNIEWIGHAWGEDNRDRARTIRMGDRRQHFLASRNGHRYLMGHFGLLTWGYVSAWTSWSGWKLAMLIIDPSLMIPHSIPPLFY